MITIKPSVSTESAHKYYNSRGVELNKLEDYEGALRDYNKAIELTPDNALYYSNRGLAYLKIGKPVKAHENFQKAATLYQQQRNTEEYKTVLRLLEAIQELPQYYKESGDELYEQKEYEAAIKEARQTIKINKLAKVNENIIVVAGMPFGIEGTTNSIRVVTI